MAPTGCNTCNSSPKCNDTVTIMPGRRRRIVPLITAAFGVPATVLAIAAGGAVQAQSQPVWQPQVVTIPVIQALPPGVGSERGLQVRTILAKRAISARFPEITDIGGARPDGMRWHPEGLAIDVIIPDYATAAGRALGDRIMAFAFANAEKFGLVHVIWQQTYFPAKGAPHRMADLGSPDANHYTHVHIATDGGGYPRASENFAR